jgi:hypothetical protein
MFARKPLRFAAALLFVLLASPAAHAQIFRAYLASDGSDANPCTLPLPCRLLPAALAAVASGGEIWILDSANYNSATVTVAKSVTILAVPGVVGSVVAAGGPAISITAAALDVTLRNLVIVPLPAAGGTHGVHMTGASRLSIEETVIANLPSNGVLVVGAGEVSIANSTIRNNGAGASGYGVRLEDGAQGEISGTKLRNNYSGVLALNANAALTTLSLTDSVISGGSYGANALASGAGKTARVNLSRCTIEGTSTALAPESLNTGLATVSVSYSMIVNNAYAWNIFGSFAYVISFRSNHFYGNTTSTGGLSPMDLQ